MAIIEEGWMEKAEEVTRAFHDCSHLIESSTDGIIACDKTGRIIIFNRSMEHMLGYERNEVIGIMSIDQVFRQGDAEKFRDSLLSDEYGGKGRLFLYETCLAGRNEPRIPVQVCAAVMVREEEEVGIVCLFRDERETKKPVQELTDQAQIFHQDKMISLGNLAASIVHEINNPLTGILNYIRLMKKKLARGSQPQEFTLEFQNYLTLMDSELSYCCQLISNLLAFARQSKLESSEVRINELISRIIILNENRLALRNIRCEKLLDTKGPVVNGDYSLLQQCVLNLIFNAMDAMSNGGTLTIESYVNDVKETAEIRVRDTGCGIPKQNLPYIFDPFFSTKEGKGLGIGLSTSYGIVARHHGTITADSEEGKGTVFTIYLPMKEKVQLV